MGDAVKISSHVPSTLCSRSVGSRWEHMILPCHDDERNCVDPKSERDQKLGKIDCVFSLYDKMRWKWDAVYLPQGLPNKYFTSLIPPLLLQFLRTPTVAHSTSVTPVSPYTHRCSLTIYLEAVIELVWRCTWGPRSGELRDGLGDHDRSSLEMNWQAMIERVWRCIWRPRWSELRYALGWRNRASLDMHVEAEMEWTERCTGMVWLSDIGGVLGGGRFGVRRDASWHSNHWLTGNCGNIESWVQHPPRYEKLAGSGILSIFGWRCTWCMLYSVN